MQVLIYQPEGSMVLLEVCVIYLVEGQSVRLFCGFLGRKV